MLIKLPKVEEATSKPLESTEKLYPRPYNSNSKPSEFDKFKNDIEYRLRHYDFYPEFFKGYQCYPECILLFDALSSYLDTYEKNIDQNAETIAFLLRQTDVNKYTPDLGSNLDMLFGQACKEKADAHCIEAYGAFKNSSPTRQKDAIALLYQYFTFERYLINREEAYI